MLGLRVALGVMVEAVRKGILTGGGLESTG